MDDRLFCRNACFKHPNVQSQVVFLPCNDDNGRDLWMGGQRKEGGSKFAACVWIYTKEVLTRGNIPTREMEEYLTRRLMSIMLCMNWICAGTFDVHEWVPESTTVQHVEEVMGMELDYKIGIPCVLQWSTRNGFGDYVRDFETIWRRAHTEVFMLASVAMVLHKTHRKWRVNKEMEGWVMRRSLELSPLLI